MIVGEDGEEVYDPYSSSGGILISVPGVVGSVLYNRWPPQPQTSAPLRTTKTDIWTFVFPTLFSQRLQLFLVILFFIENMFARLSINEKVYYFLRSLGETSKS